MEGAAAFIGKVQTGLDQFYLDLWGELTPSEPAHLYHYTSTEALVGIVSTKKLFLSDVLASTDQSEVRHGVAIVRSVLEENKEDLIPRILLGTLEKNGLWRFGSDAFVHAVCFCTGKDALTQWRGYSPNGGVAIGVDFNELKHRAESQQIALGKILYARDKQQEVVRRTINRGKEFLPELLFIIKDNPELDGQTLLAGFMTQITICILKSSLLFKHEAFSSEDEWRVFTLENKEKMSDRLRFRARGSQITPYTELPFEPSLLTEVRCSPGAWSRSAVVRKKKNCR